MSSGQSATMLYLFLLPSQLKKLKTRNLTSHTDMHTHADCTFHNPVNLTSVRLTQMSMLGMCRRVWIWIWMLSESDKFLANPKSNRFTESFESDMDSLHKVIIHCSPSFAMHSKQTNIEQLFTDVWSYYTPNGTVIFCSILYSVYTDSPSINSYSIFTSEN